MPCCVRGDFDSQYPGAFLPPVQEHYCIALGINDRDAWFANLGLQKPEPQVLRLPGGKEIRLS